jgi:preprotein translocase subunit SecF
VVFFGWSFGLGILHKLFHDCKHVLVAGHSSEYVVELNLKFVAVQTILVDMADPERDKRINLKEI